MQTGADRQAVISSSRHRAVIFDLDGVVIDTASVHAAAWRRLFNDFFAGRADTPGEITGRSPTRSTAATLTGGPGSTG